MTAEDTALRAWQEGARDRLPLQALEAAGVEPEMEAREGLYGPSVAVFGSGRTYRYLLTRRLKPGPLMIWVMLNPSVATAWDDDATIVRCTKRAGDLGLGGIAVVNLFGLISTDPAGLFTHPDPAGPGNDAALRAICQRGDVVVAAWGGHKAAWERSAEVAAMLTGNGVELLCLGTTKDGQPRHPGRLAYSVELRPWRPVPYARKVAS
jgi:hypothetical protein